MGQEMALPRPVPLDPPAFPAPGEAVYQGETEETRWKTFGTFLPEGKNPVS